MAMSERSCPVSGSGHGKCPAGKAGRTAQQTGHRGCAFSGVSQPGDVRAAFGIPEEVDTEVWLRQRERRAINDILYSEYPTVQELNQVKNVDDLQVDEKDLLAVALGAPARQVMLRAEEVGAQTGWRDGFLSAEYGFCPPDLDAPAAALANSPGRVWSDLCERIPGCIARGRVRECVAALPLIEGTEQVIPDTALWAALVTLGILCSIYRYEEKNDGFDGVSVLSHSKRTVEMSDDVIEELKGIPKTIGVPFFQISKRMGRPIPHLTFPDQSSYNVKVHDAKSGSPYVYRFDNMELRWPIFGEKTESAFLKGCADTSASFQHGPDAIASCQEHVMNRNIDGLLREMIRLKEILERMPNAFHTISPNPSSGENYVAAHRWVKWAKFSAPYSGRCPAASGLQFPPYLCMDAFLGRKGYSSFLGKEAIHLRAWQPSNLRAFTAAVEYHYSVPDFVRKSGDPRLMGVLDGIIEAYTGERGFMGVHRYKVFGILEVAGKTGRTGTNGNSGGGHDGQDRPWEETHKQFSEAMKERLRPHRGDIPVEPHQMRGTFEECRYRSKIINRAFVDNDPSRTIASVTLDIQDTGITYQPGDRLAIMPLNNWEECAKVALALGLEEMLDVPVKPDQTWARFAEHLASVTRAPTSALLVRDIVRRGHLAPLTKDIVLKIHDMLKASSSVVLQVLASTEWPVRGSLGDLLQAAVMDTPPGIWDQAFDLESDLSWLADLIPVEVPRTYSISSYPDELLPSTIDLTISRADYDLCATFSGNNQITRSGVSSGFLNPKVASSQESLPIDEDILVGVSRPVAFSLPIDGAAPCAFFAGGSGIAPFRSFWQARIGRSVGRNILYLGVQSREKFCYEHELRTYVNMGHLEVHTAFSRDSRGLAFDKYSQDLVEKPIPPRYIDTLIAEQGDTVCDLVMSKKQGGLGGHLYVCGSVSVFDSVMKGIRKAIYNHRTATMESTDDILSTAFAERRMMLDVFMTPKPLPCNLPTIPQSQLALHTGHRDNTEIWIGVHGKVYNVTDFCPMHPGGTLIIKSNAGVDCSRAFNELAHTTNPEVSSLLTKYFVGHLTPKPDYNNSIPELGGLYDAWLDYLRTSVETLVAHHFEMNEMLGTAIDSPLDPSRAWFQGDLFSMVGVRGFYQYQSRLLQGGFAAMFGPRFQELVLKLSFSLANAASDGASTRLPDILGVIAKAKTSADAVAVSRQVSLIGEFIGNSQGARFHEKGIIAYACRSVELDIALLEDIRQEACYGMDAFESIGELDRSSESEVITALVGFLLQALERMAKRLEVFYSNLAQYNIYQPEIERNPARTRWHRLRQRVRDGSFFVLTQDTTLRAAPATYMPQKPTVDFDNVMTQVQTTLAREPQFVRNKSGPEPTLADMHSARAHINPNGASTLETHENTAAIHNMSSFIDKNMRSIRRLSRMPHMPISYEELARLAQVNGGAQGAGANGGNFYPTHGKSNITANLPISPPSSRGSSRSPTRSNALAQGAQSRGRSTSKASTARQPLHSASGSSIRVMNGEGGTSKHHRQKSSASSSSSTSSSRMMMTTMMNNDLNNPIAVPKHPALQQHQQRPPTPPVLDGSQAMSALVTKLNIRPRRPTAPSHAPPSFSPATSYTQFTPTTGERVGASEYLTHSRGASQSGRQPFSMMQQQQQQQHSGRQMSPASDAGSTATSLSRRMRMMTTAMMNGGGGSNAPSPPSVAGSSAGSVNGRERGISRSASVSRTNSLRTFKLGQQQQQQQQQLNESIAPTF